jgi:hypothetical protein
MGAPLVLRRRAPLQMWLAIWAALALLALLTDYRPRGLEFTFVLFTAAYSLGAHASLRRAVVGLAVTVPVLAEITDKGGLGLIFAQHFGAVAVALSSLHLLAFWLAWHERHRGDHPAGPGRVPGTDPDADHLQPGRVRLPRPQGGRERLPAQRRQP